MGGGSSDIIYEFIDLGLSVNWCTCNIGATKPEECGWYFMWGDTIPYNNDKTPVSGGSPVGFGWSNYPLCNGSLETITKYCTDSSYGTVDNKTVLEQEDDAAYMHTDGKCRMPSEAEYDELINACNIEWITNYNDTGINGRLLTLKTDSSKTLFFPSAGYLHSTSVSDIGRGGDYWTNSINKSLSYDARYLRFTSGVFVLSNAYRYYGASIRAVCSK